MIDTKPALPLADTGNQSQTAGTDAERNGNGSHSIETSATNDLRISLLPSIFEVVKSMEKKEAASLSASDVTNQLNQFHSKLKKTREAVEKHLPASTIGNRCWPDFFFLGGGGGW